MSKFNEFYVNVMADENKKKKLESILDGGSMLNADDGKLKKIGELAKELGYDISVEEAKDFFEMDGKELDDDALESVAGGKGQTYHTDVYICGTGGQAGVDEGNFGEGAQPVNRTV